jgi:carbonic anhydrase
MHFAKPCPNQSRPRSRGGRATGFSENKAWYKRLAEEGQHPRAMIISCCDSRVHATSIFGADSGEFFIHRNIANLVPPFETDGGLHGTSATIEYAVTALKVAHIIVLGHSNCGGVKGCIDMCSGNAPQLEEDSSFVGRWIDILRPGYEKVKKTSEPETLQEDMEKQAVLTSLSNLMTFPFVKAGVEEENLSLHGLWTDIAEGSLEVFDPSRGEFTPI